MDRASYLVIFTKVMLPLAIPAIVTIAVLQFIQIWDDLPIGLRCSRRRRSARSRSG
jgi:ABC-type glycerol-3-phosphate transport system permease component